MQVITHTVTEPNGKVTKQSSMEKLSFAAPFEINDKTPKNQLYTINKWNEMRQRLLDLGEMEPK